MTEALPAGKANAHTLLWVTLTIVVGLLVPLGGFVVAAISRLPRTRDRAPRLVLLLAIAAIVLAIQLIGLASWGPSIPMLGTPERMP